MRFGVSQQRPVPPMAMFHRVSERSRNTSNVRSHSFLSAPISALLRWITSRTQKLYCDDENRPPMHLLSKPTPMARLAMRTSHFLTICGTEQQWIETMGMFGQAARGGHNSGNYRRAQSLAATQNDHRATNLSLFRVDLPRDGQG